jgi:hypothetical protein
MRGSEIFSWVPAGSPHDGGVQDYGSGEGREKRQEGGGEVREVTNQRRSKSR